MSRPAAPRRREEGSALIIALVFTTAVSLMVAGVLAFADVGVRSSEAYKQRSGATYAADGAIAAAMKRYSTTGPCENLTAPLVARDPMVPDATDQPVNGFGTLVRCEGRSQAGSKATQPLNSLLSLETDPAKGGIRSSQNLRLLGDVYSNTTVTVDPGTTLVVEGQVSAEGSCDDRRIQTVPPTPLRCANTGTGADTSRGRDPGYVAAATAVPARPDVPPCPAGWLATLEPGYYDDAAALNRLTAPPPEQPCDDKVVWLKPGTYYFDLGFRGGPNTWTVNNDKVTVVAGTPKGWDPADPVLPSLSIPGGCETGGGAAPGVQLIAGGATRLDVVKGRMEVCATTPDPEAPDQQIALYGLGEPPSPHTLEGEVVATGFTTCVPAAPAGCSPTLNAQTVEETPVAAVAAALRADGSPPLLSAKLELDDFRPRVPTGSLIDDAVLRVSHQEDGGPVDVSVTADFPSNGASPSQCGAEGTPRTLTSSPGTMASDPISLKAVCGLTTPEQLAGLAVTYNVALAPGATTADVQVDGLVVEVAYRTPVTRKPTFVVSETGFADESNALEIDERPGPLTANADITSSANNASLTVAGFEDPPLAAGTPLDSAVLRVAHRDEGDTEGPKVTLSLDSCADQPLPLRPTITEDRIDLKACGLDNADELRGLTATFTTALKPDGLAALSRLDGMALEVVPAATAGPAPATLRRAASAISTSPGPDSATFAPADAARAIGGSPPETAGATLSGLVNTAALSVEDFAGTPLPTGSVLRSAKLKVAHQDGPGIGSVGVTASVSQGPLCPSLNRPGSAGVFVTDEVDLTPCLTSPDQLRGLKAIYTATRTANPTAATLRPDLAVGDGFANAQENGRLIDDGATADAALVAGGVEAATVRLSGYGAGRPPNGSTIEKATLRIGHRDVGAVPTVEVLYADPACTRTFDALPAGGVDTIDLKVDCGLTDPAQLDQLSVLYRADLAPGSTDASDFLDGVELVVEYRPPASDQLDGIELVLDVEVPALRPLCDDPSKDPCERVQDLVKVRPDPADPKTRFVASGTIYAPTAGVDISMFKLDQQVLRRGVIANTIHLGLQPKEGFQRPAGAIPPELVTFTAYPAEQRKAGDADSPSENEFDLPDNARAIREDPAATATATLTESMASATLELREYALPPDPEEDVPVALAMLLVRHQDEGNTVKVSVAVDPPGDADERVCVERDLPPSPLRLSEDWVDLTQNVGPADPSCRIDTQDKLARVKVLYDVVLAPGSTEATATLDGIVLLPPALVRARVTFDRAKAKVESWNVLR